jgi:hypothetical protein
MQYPFGFPSEDAPSLALGSLLGMPGSAAGSAGPTTLLLDHFSDANGTSLSAHTMDVGPGWALSGTWTIQSNHAQCSAAGGAGWGLAYADAGVANATASVTLVQAANGIGIVGRLQDSNNFFFAYIGGSNATIVLWEMSAGSLVNRGSAATSFQVGDVLSIQASGTTITARQSGSASASVSYTSTDFQTATKWGLYDDLPTQSFGTFTTTSP